MDFDRRWVQRYTQAKFSCMQHESHKLSEVNRTGHLERVLKDLRRRRDDSTDSLENLCPAEELTMTEKADL